MLLKTTARFLLSLATMAVACGTSAQQAAPPAPPSRDFVISGTLVDSLSSQPIAHARVAIAPVTKRNDFTTVITGEDGVFSFTNLTPGKYALTAQARGYLLQSFNQHDQFASSIVVGPDSDSRQLLFRLPPTCAIAGIVTDEAGEPVRDAQVSLYFTGLSAGTDVTQSRGGTTTDDQGAFHFGHLAPGHYLVAVSARPWYAQRPLDLPATVPGDPAVRSYVESLTISQSALDVAYPVTFYGGATDPAAATTLTLGPGDRVTANITLQPVRALRVHLSKDVQGTRAFLQGSILGGLSLPVMTETHFSGSGEQEIVGIPPGRYTLTTNEVGPVSTREIEINASGEIDQNQGIVYVPVSAKLQFDPGTKPSQPYVQLLNKKTRVVSSERVGDEGEAVFKQGVPPGTYEVSINNAPGFYLKNIFAVGARVTGRTIEVRSGATVKLAISAARGQGEIAGIASHDGKPSAGAMIVLVPADPAHNQVLFRRDQSDSDGSFTLPQVVPGAYTLLALEHGWDLAWTDPEVLKNYLGRGVAVRVQPNGKYEVKVDVQ
ncbi:MAG TPA: carboxypeptidase-like regulatory domain-containing protein [Candidatus Angelobacter sp.]|nr:carboxypeptidase-like regulatory domain-containing protein [Candidatus Angelobacter sp.]